MGCGLGLEAELALGLETGGNLNGIGIGIVVGNENYIEIGTINWMKIGPKIDADMGIGREQAGPELGQTQPKPGFKFVCNCLGWA